MVKLSERLKAAASLAGKTYKIIDVGCDHAYLAVYMLQNGMTRFAFLSDINAGPLKKAEETVVKYGLTDKVKLFLGDGLKPYSKDCADTVFICGLGGEIIADIISKAPWLKNDNITLILQPMTRDEHLREYLFKEGFTVTDERLVSEDGHLYIIMKVSCGDGADLRNNMFIFSDSLKKEPLFKDYIQKKKTSRLSALNGKRISGIDTTSEETVMRFLEEQYAD